VAMVALCTVEIAVGQDLGGAEMAVGKDGGGWAWHNFFVAVMMLLFAAWGAKVGWQLLNLAMLSQQMEGQGRPLQLQRMSIYAEDFGTLIRQHFNQILRMRQTVPPQPMPRYNLVSHVDPNSIQLVNANGAYGASFVVDAAVPCRARLYWGVQAAACEDLPERLREGRGKAPSSAERGASASSFSAARSLLELGQNLHSLHGVGAVSSEDPDILFSSDEYAACSESFLIAPGEGKACILARAGDLVQAEGLGFDLNIRNLPGEAAPELVPLVIILSATSDGPQRLDEEPTLGRPPPVGTVAEATLGEATLVGFRREERGAETPLLKPEVWHQLALGDECAHRELGIYGFEEGEEETDCMICYDRPRSVVLLPCRHCSVCSSCLRSLRDERCPLCRATFHAHIQISLRRTDNAPDASPSGGQSPHAVL